MAKIEIHIRDTQNGGTEIMVRGDFTDGKDVSWDALQGRKKMGVLTPGAEALTYRTIMTIQELLAKAQIPLIAPAPKMWVPPTSKPGAVQ